MSPEILMYLRSIKKNKNESYLYDPIGTDKEGNEITLFDILGSNTDEVIDKVSFSINKDKIYNIIDKLSEREQKVLKWRYGLNSGDKKTQKEVADELGISRSYVSRIEKSVIKKVSKEFLATKDFSKTTGYPLN
nr:sigma-70 family RNA polymerase sigma factor [Natranaerofaba carboxydovora]